MIAENNSHDRTAGLQTTDSAHIHPPHWVKSHRTTTDDTLLMALFDFNSTIDTQYTQICCFKYISVEPVKYCSHFIILHTVHWDSRFNSPVQGRRLLVVSLCRHYCWLESPLLLLCSWCSLSFFSLFLKESEYEQIKMTKKKQTKKTHWGENPHSFKEQRPKRVVATARALGRWGKNNR